MYLHVCFTGLAQRLCRWWLLHVVSLAGRFEMVRARVAFESIGMHCGEVLGHWMYDVVGTGCLQPAASVLTQHTGMIGTES